MFDQPFIDYMRVLSECDIGAFLTDRNQKLLYINDTGDRLLHGNGSLCQKPLSSPAKLLCEATSSQTFIPIGFNEYLKRRFQTIPIVLPEHTTLVLFRDATDDHRLNMLESVVNHMREGLVMCDADGRLNFLNDAAIKLDSLVEEHVLGEKVCEVYEMNDHQNCLLPKVIASKQPILSQRHRYTTRFGKKVDAIANSYPALREGQLLGAFNIVEDWRAVDDMHKQIINLQERLSLQEDPKIGSTPIKNTHQAKYNFEDIVSVSASMHSLIEQCRQVADTDYPVLIYGETGTGKELFSQSLHNASSRSNTPFIAINCAALPENLLEGLLFGTVKGSFTGAENRAGLFEQANHGTLLLDEINSMDITLQAKLLRVLQDGMVRRVGGTTETKVDVRIISCMNIPPLQAIAENKLRQDLFYRLGVINLEIPPLRDRKEDIELLTKHFIMQCNEKLQKNVRTTDTQTKELFMSYNWPGNARELQHAIEQAMIIIPNDQTLLSKDYLPKTISMQNTSVKDPVVSAEHSLPGKLQNIEKDAVCKVLAENNGNISRSAQVLKISRQNLQYRIKRYNIRIEDYRKG